MNLEEGTKQRDNQFLTLWIPSGNVSRTSNSLVNFFMQIGVMTIDKGCTVV